MLISNDKKWWRRRESNPRPERIHVGVYVCIPRITTLTGFQGRP